MDPERRRVHSRGWTDPANHPKYGEDPRQAARRLGEEVLQIPELEYSLPLVDAEYYEPSRHPGTIHYDIRFLFEGTPVNHAVVEKPPGMRAWNGRTRGLSRGKPAPGATKMS